MHIRIDEIRDHVGSHFSVSRAAMLGNSHQRKVARPRQIAMYLARKLTEQTLTAIGRRFGYRDHTTVLHAERNIALIMDQNEEFRVAVESIEADIIGRNFHAAAIKASDAAWQEFSERGPSWTGIGAR